MRHNARLTIGLLSFVSLTLLAPVLHAQGYLFVAV